MRGEKRFESVETLVEQMNADVEQARQICTETRYPAA
jgi:FAD synthase